ncbi:MAG: ABC transporter ATP-binding protein [Actinomycetota bacterium]|nr:ABC transporter ATP-binding protein [Actinomycetota bacterium]
MEVRGAVKRFGAVRALDGADLTVDHGQIVALLGPSGCGKSTLLRAVAGIERLDAGSVRLDGTDVGGVDPAHRGAAMVFQDGALFPHLTVRHNIAVGLAGSLRRAARRSDAIGPIAERLRISELLDRHPHQLSGGQRQRVGIARALVGRPRVMLLDEPFSSLDAELRVELRRELRRLHAEGSVGDAVFVTHDQGEATGVADRVAVMREGRIVQVGTPIELIEAPVNLFVATFVGVPRVNAIDTADRVWCLRPSDADLIEADPGAIGPVDGVVVEVVVISAEPSGGSWLARVRTPAGVDLDVVVAWRAGARPGPRARLVVPPDRVLAFERRDGSRTTSPGRADLEGLLCGSA